MMDTTVSPAYLIRSYAWALLKANDPDTWDETKYGGLIPIVPLAEEPELSEYDGPHIVYGYANDPTGDLPARKGGSLTFAIYDQNFRRLTKTVTVLQTAFERKDETARDVNEYTSWVTSSALDADENPIKPFIGITFGFIDIGFVEGGSPEETEGGRQSALVNIRYEYHVDYAVKTTLAEFNS